MAFKGTLKEFKVPDILQLISMQKKTGILTFNSNEGFITIIFEDGFIVGVDAFPKKLEMRVGSVLVKQEIISEEMLQRALAIQKRTGQKVGEILSAMGLIDEKTIPEALKIQATQIVLSLFTWKKGEYNFKVMDFMEDELKTLKPMSADNLIMEGVQMLDEWPLIKKVIPAEDYVFEPSSLGNKKIEVVSDNYDEMETSDENVLFLSETEVSLLKYVNGRNSVRDLVEMGLFTEYKIYKNLYNLVNKKLIHKKEKTENFESTETRVEEQFLRDTKRKVDFSFRALLFIMILLFVLTFFTPFSPLVKGNLLFQRPLYQKIFQIDR
jgi:hypothetical protein